MFFVIFFVLCCGMLRRCGVERLPKCDLLLSVYSSFLWMDKWVMGTEMKESEVGIERDLDVVPWYCPQVLFFVA